MGLQNVNTDLLRALESVARHKGFTAASVELFRTQSAISLQIKRLEEIVERRLLNRDKEITLTSDGEIVLSYAKKILQLNDDLLETVLDTQETNIIKIGTPDDLAHIFFSPILQQLHHFNQSSEFQITSDLSVNLLKKLKNNEIDIAFVALSPNFTALALRYEALSWVSSKKFEMHSNDIVPLALFPDGCAFREAALSALEKIGRNWKVKYSSNQFYPLQSVLKSGSAIGVLPTRSIPEDLVCRDGDFGLPKISSAKLSLNITDNCSDNIRNLAGMIAEVI